MTARLTMKPLDPIHVSLGGTHLIDASAGTGKTYTIETIYLRLLVELGLTVDRILVVTFTEAATKELTGRIRERLTRGLADLNRGQSDDEVVNHFLETDRTRATARIHKALSCFDEAAISTIHSFCQQMLRENAFESGILFDMELMADQSSLYLDIAHDFFAAEVYDQPLVFAQYLKDEAKLGIKEITTLVKTIAAGQDLVVIPHAPVETDATTPFLQTYTAARDIWWKDRNDIIALVTDDKNINHRSYKKNLILGWAGAVDAYLTPEEPIRVCSLKIDGADRIMRFSASTIAAFTKEGMAPPTHRFFDAGETLLQARKLFDQQLIGFKHKLINYALKELAQRKLEQGVLSFDDLLNHLDRALNGDQGDALIKAIRDRYGAALVDEFQDTDRTQYRIFDRIYQDNAAPFFLIGDPKQSIYSFRGADIFSFR